MAAMAKTYKKELDAQALGMMTWRNKELTKKTWDKIYETTDIPMRIISNKNLLLLLILNNVKTR